MIDILDCWSAIVHGARKTDNQESSASIDKTGHVQNELGPNRVDSDWTAPYMLTRQHT